VAAMLLAIHEPNAFELLRDKIMPIAKADLHPTPNCEALGKLFSNGIALLMCTVTIPTMKQKKFPTCALIHLSVSRHFISSPGHLDHFSAWI